jgi:hypothetical protein
MGSEALTLWSERMDTVGDAEQYDYDDEPPRPRAPLLTSEALAVTSLATAMGSFLVTTISQYLVFVFAGALGFRTGESDQEKQVAILLAPTALLSLAAVAAGVIALKRRPEDRWVGAFAGVAVGAVILLLAGAALLAMLITDPSANSN